MNKKVILSLTITGFIIGCFSALFSFLFYKNILNESELAKHGVMILGTNVNEVQYFQDILSVHDKIKEYSFKTKNLFGKGKKYTLYYSIIKPTIIIK